MTGRAQDEGPTGLAALVLGLRSKGVTDRQVLSAIETTPRDIFTPDLFKERSFEDSALPIACGQTISQPFIVGLMTQALGLDQRSRVLEIGTGSGYQTAILAALDYGEVYSLEIIPELAQAAAARLTALGYTRVHLAEGDGYNGWPEHAPYDAILVTAAPECVPPALITQLADGGRLVIPVGPRFTYQTLHRLIKHGDSFEIEAGLSVAFVPLTRHR